MLAFPGLSNLDKHISHSSTPCSMPGFVACGFAKMVTVLLRDGSEFVRDIGDVVRQILYDVHDVDTRVRP